MPIIMYFLQPVENVSSVGDDVLRLRPYCDLTDCLIKALVQRFSQGSMYGSALYN